MGDPLDLERRALAIFEECIDLEAADRTKVLAARCGGDVELSRAVSRLLTLHDTEGSTSIGSSSRGSDPARIVGAAAAAMVDEELPTATEAGSRLGPWAIVRRIGRGGMGEVFLGRRADGTFEREVAIKRLRATGLDAELVARFHRERRVLASLDHENIARLLDAGEDESGDPFLVMEYVAGERIDHYCDRLALGVDHRIRLFLKVCEATQYAHRLGFIHRDLKPANILVAESESGGEGVPKLLDFGIAGVLRERTLEGDSKLTVDPLRYMTPAYASPEQLKRAPLTVASDQYSLGIILYELLTGALPHDFTSCSPAEIERSREETPPPPSQRAETTAATIDEPAAELRASRRAATPAALRRRLRGDLDRIVLMALRPEPDRRYASVADLADDLRRSLDGRPVRAQPDSAWYRVSRFVSRNRLPVAIFTGVVIAIGSALVVTLDALDDSKSAKAAAEVDRGRAVNAKALAEEGLADSDAVTAFLTEMLASGEPWEMGRDVAVREVLDRSAAEVDARFGSRPLIAARIHATIGRAYARLGVLEPARHHAERALSLFEARLPDSDARVRDALSVVGMVHKAAGHFDLALAAFERLLLAVRSEFGEESSSRYSLENDTGGVLRAMERFDLAEPRFRLAIEGFERLRGAESAELCQPTNNLGVLLLQTGRFDEAEIHLDRSQNLYALHRPPDHPESLVVEHNRGLLRIKTRRYQEAFDLLQPLLARFETVMGQDHPQTSETRNLVASALMDLGRGAEALALRDASVESAQRAHGPRSIEAGEALLRAAELRFRTGEVEAAEAQTYEAMVILEALAPPENPERARAFRAHSVTLSRIGDLAPAIFELEQSLASLRASGRDDDEVARAWLDLANLQVRAKDPHGAVRSGLNWLAMSQDEVAAASDRALLMLRNTAAHLANLGCRSAADDLLQTAYRVACDREGPAGTNTAKVIQSLARLHASPTSPQHEFWAREQERLPVAAGAKPLRDG
jgi:eukaryotic-like serine/threonine-protein kinase